MSDASSRGAGQGSWTRELNRYHWFVLTVAALGWLFDTMDQQLFVLARQPAMNELLPDKASADYYGPIATSVFLLGWATGGIVFGMLGDRIGRAKTMMLTILVYSAFTGLNAVAVGFWDFALYRFLTGLGVGGEFAVGVALVAEVMPDRARPFALGLLQALSAVGNVTAALISLGLGELEETGISAWRVMFLIGTLPALLALVIRRRLKEPERWQAQSQSAGGEVQQRLGSLRDLLGDPRWRSRALVGLCLAFAGVVGLWGIAFFSPELIRPVFEQHFKAQGLAPAAVKAGVTRWVAINMILQNVGGFFGIYGFSYLTHWMGRKPAFAISFVAAMATTALFFWTFNDFSDVFWMTPLMGFAQLSLFGGYAIYFPELFPTRLRSTGTSFCYNVGRFVAAIGPFTLGYLIRQVYAGYAEPIRYAGVTMCAVFLLGLAVLPLAPETRGHPLPE